MTTDESMMNRCRRAYKNARVLACAGTAFLAFGASSGLVSFLSLIMYLNIPLGHHNAYAPDLFTVTVVSCLTSLLGLGFGSVIHAQGRILRASMDSAVNTSPFLSAEERKIVLELEPRIEVDQRKPVLLSEPAERASCREWENAYPNPSPVTLLIAERETSAGPADQTPDVQRGGAASRSARHYSRSSEHSQYRPWKSSDSREAGRASGWNTRDEKILGIIYMLLPLLGMLNTWGCGNFDVCLRRIAIFLAPTFPGSLIGGMMIRPFFAGPSLTHLYLSMIIGVVLNMLFYMRIARPALGWLVRRLQRRYARWD